MTTSQFCTLKKALLVVPALLLATGTLAKAQGSVAGNEPAAGTTIVHPRDGSLMVYVPAGSFTMGISQEEGDALAKSLGYKDHRAIAAEEWFPKHQKYVEGFFIDKYEVTLELWHKFTAATAYKPKLNKGPARMGEVAMGLFPVAQVTWGEAQSYANWAHKELPYEAQWEKAARGTDGRLYPWGNEPPTPERGVFIDLKANKETVYQMVGSKAAGISPYGCMDMAGNVYEWTREWMEPYANNPEADKIATFGHKFGCLRGGSFYHSKLAYSAAKRFGLEPEETYYHIGFRTVWTPPAGYFASDEFKQAAARVPERTAELDKLRELGAGVALPASWF